MAKVHLRAWAERAVVGAWDRRGVLACLLWPLSQLYRLALAVRPKVSGQETLPVLPVPAVVIGNVVAGGAGKTPTTLWVVRYLLGRGWHPGIVSRGYGRAHGEVLLVGCGDDPLLVGDEPLLLARQSAVPVAVGRERIKAACALLAAHGQVDVLIFDDGLQHAPLVADVRICVFDARGLGNGWLLPAGPLRQRWPSAVDLVLGTEGALPVTVPLGAQGFVASRSLAPLARRADGARLELAALRGQKIAALAAIARPQAFFTMLRACGLTLERTLPLPDHANLQDPHHKLEQALSGGNIWLCTEKDAVKLWRVYPDAWAVELQLQVGEEFGQALEVLLHQRGYHQRL